jgi:hypothetical protein
VSVARHVDFDEFLGVANRSVFRTTALIRLKMAVFAPIPSASETIATAANPGLDRSERSA